MISLEPNVILMKKIRYNMVGHLKFCLTLLGGYFLFGDHLNSLQVLGIITTLTGMSTEDRSI